MARPVSFVRSLISWLLIFSYCSTCLSLSPSFSISLSGINSREYNKTSHIRLILRGLTYPYVVNADKPGKCRKESRQLRYGEKRWNARHMEF